MGWIKGAKCGIDNCASRFYQIQSGQRVCQNGHVQVGLEIRGDDDDFVAVGQRIAKPRSQDASQLARAAKESEILRGHAARLKSLELLQLVYKTQIHCVASKSNLPPAFEQTAKTLWALFLTAKKNGGKVTLVELVCLNYLATRALDFPLLLSDFNMWIKSGSFPYIDCWKIVDYKQYKLLPGELRRHFRPSAEPGILGLHKTTQALKHLLRSRFTHPYLNFPNIDERYVCYRLCQNLMFAPQIYVGALRLLEVTDRARLEREPSLVSEEEMPAACAVIVAAKLYYGMDDIPRKLPENRQGNEFNWDVWCDLMRKAWLMQPDFGRADERLVQYWDGDSMDNYISWFQQQLGDETENFDKRLDSMFPLDVNEVSARTDGKTRPPDARALNELCALLHSVEDNRTAAQSPELAPGSNYHVYSVRSDVADELPEPVGILYNVISTFLGADEINVRRFVRVFERWIKSQHAHLIVAAAS